MLKVCKKKKCLEFKAIGFVGYPKYTTACVTDTMQAFIDWFRNGAGAASYEEDGMMCYPRFTFALGRLDDIYIIREDVAGRQLYTPRESYDVALLAEELVKDIESDIKGFASVQGIDDEHKDVAANVRFIREKLVELRQEIRLWNEA